MSDRESRVARNEAASRGINEDIEEAHVDESSDRPIRVLCECGRSECDSLIAITTAEYERVREDPRRFVVRHDHVDRTVEDVEYETDRFVVVRKRAGTPASVAVEEDPRS